MIWTSESRKTETEKRQEEELLCTRKLLVTLSPAQRCWLLRTEANQCLLLCLPWLPEVPAQGKLPSRALGSAAADSGDLFAKHKRNSSWDSVCLGRVAGHLERVLVTVHRYCS